MTPVVSCRATTSLVLLCSFITHSCCFSGSGATQTRLGRARRSRNTLLLQAISLPQFEQAFEDGSVAAAVAEESSTLQLLHDVGMVDDNSHANEDVLFSSSCSSVDAFRQAHPYSNPNVPSSGTSLESATNWLQTVVWPVAAASLLITSNTIGAGMLVLPQLAAPLGLSASSMVLTTCYLLNLLSGLVLAQVAILQYEEQLRVNPTGTEVPASFKELAFANLSPNIAPIISLTSLFVNTCVMTFAFTRVGTVGLDLWSTITAATAASAATTMATTTAPTVPSLHEIAPPLPLSVDIMVSQFGSFLSSASTASTFNFPSLYNSLNEIAPLPVSVDIMLSQFVSFCSGMVQEQHSSQQWTVSAAFASMITLALSTFSPKQLSTIASGCVAVTFASLGAWLGPSVMDLLLHPAAAAGAVAGSATSTLATSTSMTEALSQAAPVMLMALIYQNIVPTICKILDYDRTKVTSAITLGSLAPLLIYGVFCWVSLGGAAAGAAVVADNHALYSLFSMATLTGCGLCTTMSLIEEVDTFVNRGGTATKQQPDPPISETLSAAAELSNNSPPASAAAADQNYSIPSVMVSVTVPLLAAFGLSVVGSNTIDLTETLAIAGSFGSPLLYGILPALMAWNQQQKLQQQQQQILPVESMDNNNNNNMPSQERFSLGWSTQASSSSSSPLDSLRNALLRLENDNNKNTSNNLVPTASLGLLGLLSTAFVGEEFVHRVTDVINVAVSSST